MKIEFKKVNKSFESKNSSDSMLALNDISLGVNNSEVLCVVGPSGCGKSTIINLIAGFIFPDNGEVLWITN